MLETALTAFTTFFAVIGPIDSAVIAASLTPHATKAERRAISLKAVAIATLIVLAFALVGFTLFVTSRLIRMPIGRAWEALREDEIACRSLGLNPTRIKLSAFTLGASFAGLAGAFFAARQGLVTPESFTFIESALILAVVVLGGMGSQIGVILAAVLLTVLPEVARDFAEYRMLIFGLVMVLMMMWRPQGLLPATRPHVELPQ